MPIAVSQQTNQRRETFFRAVFGSGTGYVCIAYLVPGKEGLTQEFFYYPDDVPQMLEYINRHYVGNNMYFCTQLLSQRRRTKEDVASCTVAWSDLDRCNPALLLVKPTISVETSPSRYQALWCFDRPIEPVDAEDISRKIAYYHKGDGADISGWPLSKLLRIPLTYNFKYGASGEAPEVLVVATTNARYRVSDFDKYPQSEGSAYLDLPLPTILPEGDADSILHRYRLKVSPRVWALHSEAPSSGSWSEPLWSLIMLLIEAGMSREETLLVAWEAKCNKWARDGKAKVYLWKDICKAWARHEQRIQIIVPRAQASTPLLTDDERKQVLGTPSVVEEYIEWAKSLGDAAWQYHQAGAFTVLSSLLAGTVRLPTSFGTMIPNLWFMILADTTLTRKSTAMDIAMDMILEIDPDAVLATDGSIEGLMTSLSMRPGRPSIFLRDEFSGLLEMMTKKDYYAGMAEVLTKLYDGKFQKRILRKETIEVKDPVLNIFAGGIKNRVCQLMTYEHVASGFLPRFIFVTAESDVAKLQPLGPPTDTDTTARELLLSRFRDIHAHYHTEQAVLIGQTGVTLSAPRRWSARLTPEAWTRYNVLESQLVTAGVEAQHPEIMTPTYDRLSKSGLKAAVLLAASRQRPEGEVIVEEHDVVRGFFYVEGWREYVHEVINNLGKSASEKQLDLILKAIRLRPGVGRSLLMQNYHLSAREASAIFDTLEQRGQITRQRSGKVENFYAVEQA